MPEQFSNTARVFSPRRRQLEEAGRAYAAGLMSDHPEVVEIIWFGSWVTGRASIRSDVDLCLLLSGSPIPRIRDRIPLYLPDRVPSGIDVFPYTIEEFEAFRSTAPSWWKAIRSGSTIARRAEPR